VINSSCNGIRIIGPATRLIIHDCLVYGPGAQPHRTSGAARRTNMLAGIILQPGAWEPMPGPLDDVLISDITMRDVASPLTLWTREGNPTGRITVERLNATGIYRAAASVESWGDTPLTNVVFRDVNLEFAGGGRAEASQQVVKRPGVDCRPLPAWGFYARNVGKLTLEDVRFSAAADDFRPVLLADTVKQLDLDHVRFPQVPGVREPVLTTNVGTLNIRETALPSANR
jgi:hypothetical protein